MPERRRLGSLLPAYLKINRPFALLVEGSPRRPFEGDGGTNGEDWTEYTPWLQKSDWFWRISTPVFQCRQSAGTSCVGFTFRWIQRPRKDKMMEDKIMLVFRIILSLMILTNSWFSATLRLIRDGL